MLRQLKKNDKGIVFVTVLAMIIVLMVMAISVISINVSQSVNTEGEIKRIEAEVYAMGALAKTFAIQMSNAPVNEWTDSATMNGVQFTVSSNINSPTAGPNGTSLLNIVVTY